MSDVKELPPPDSELGARDKRRLPGYVYSEHLIQQAARVETMAAREARKTKRVNRALVAYSVMITALFIMQGVSLTYAIPLIRIMPVYFWSRSDGVIEAALTTDSMPTKNWGDMAVQTFLWQYVRARESYSYQEQDMNNYIVQTMSSKPVSELYQQWSNGKNPKSHQAILGKKGVIRIEMVDVLNYQPSIDQQPGRVTFHYEQKVWVEGEPEQNPSAFSVTLEFIKDYPNGFNMKNIMMNNPFRIVVTAYPGAYPLSIKPGSR
jgi:type IV secretory pathway component VirB8